MITFSIHKYTIGVHFTFFILIAFCCVFTGFERSGIMLITVLLHEISHIIAMMMCKMAPEKIFISALGCNVHVSKFTGTAHGKDIFIYLCGPAFNLLIACIFILLGKYHLFFTQTNLIVGIFHLLPIEPLDGGLALRSVLLKLTDERTAGKISFIVSLCLVAPLTVFGLIVLLHTGQNYSLLFLSIYFAIYLILRKNTVIR